MMPHAHEQPATMAEEPHQHPYDDGTHRCADHDHEPAHDRMGRLRASVPFLHGHRHGEASVDRAMETSDLSAAFSSLSFWASSSVISAVYSFSLPS